jgi:hypothetical protein
MCLLVCPSGNHKEKCRKAGTKISNATTHAPAAKPLAKPSAKSKFRSPCAPRPRPKGRRIQAYSMGGDRNQSTDEEEPINAPNLGSVGDVQYQTTAENKAESALKNDTSIILSSLLHLERNASKMSRKNELLNGTNMSSEINVAPWCPDSREIEPTIAIILRGMVFRRGGRFSVSCRLDAKHKQFSATTSLLKKVIEPLEGSCNANVDIYGVATHAPSDPSCKCVPAAHMNLIVHSACNIHVPSHASFICSARSLQVRSPTKSSWPSS